MRKKAHSLPRYKKVKVGKRFINLHELPSASKSERVEEDFKDG